VFDDTLAILINANMLLPAWWLDQQCQSIPYPSTYCLSTFYNYSTSLQSK